MYLGVQAQKASVTVYVQEIESNSEYVINYDNSTTDAIYSDFAFEGNYSEANIRRFFQSISLKIVVKENAILILPIEYAKNKLCGTLISEEGDLLSFANIYIDSINGTETDLQGNFSVAYDGPADQVCIISYLGFEDLPIRISRVSQCDTIIMKRASLLFSESVIIKSYIFKGIQEGDSYGSLEIDLSNNVHDMNGKGQDVLRYIQNLPGISSPDDAATNLNVRGGSSDHNFISWEGTPLYDQGYLSGMISSINPFSIDKISINKSNTSAEKNCRIGGVIDMHLTEDMIHKNTLSSGLNFTEGHLNIGLPIVKEKLGIFFSGRKSLFGNFEYNPTFKSYGQTILQSERIEQDGEPEISEEIEPSVSFQDINAKLVAQINDRFQFRSSFLVTSGKNDNFSSFRSINLNVRDEYKTSSHAFANYLEYKINDKQTLELNYSLSDYSNEVMLEHTNDSIPSFITKEETSNTILDQQVKLKLSGSAGRSKYSGGYIFDFKQTSLKFEEESSIHAEFEEESKVDGQFHHLFFDQALKFDRQLFEYGVRATYANSLSSLYFSPSLSYRYRISPHLIIKTNAGIYHQFIRQIYETVEDDVNNETPIWALNFDSDEPIMRAQKVALGGSWKKNGWLIDIDAYLHKTSGLIAENPNIRNSIIVDKKNTLISKGIDFLLSKSRKNWTGSIYYSLSENTVTLPSIYEDERESFFANNNQTHKLKFNNAYRIKTFQIDLTYDFRSGLPFSSDEIIEESEDDEDEFELQYERINNDLLSSYHRLDFSIKREWEWKSMNFSLGISVLNILNRENVGSRKTFLAETESSNDTPEVHEVEKNLLPRTLVFHARLFF